MSRPIGQCAIYDKDEIEQDVTDRTGPLYDKNETGLSWSIWQSTVYDEY